MSTPEEMDVDYKSAARRHFKDAELLYGSDAHLMIGRIQVPDIYRVAFDLGRHG